MSQKLALKKDLHVIPPEKENKGLHAQTSIEIGIREALGVVFGLREQVITTGPSGIGKTKAAEEFVDEHRDEAVLIRLGVAVRCMGTLLTMIANALGSGYARSNNTFIKYIIEKLEWSRTFLIFDEAQFLSWEMWEILREVHDKAKVGIAYLGQPRLYAQMKGKGGAFLFDQIQGRIAIRRVFGNTVSLEDVRIVAESLHPGLNNKTVSFLHKKCQGDGKFRRMYYILKTAEEMAIRNNVPVDHIDHSFIVRVARSLGY